MFTLLVLFAVLCAYLTPGIILARGMYSDAVRIMREQDMVLVPPRPKRPRIRVPELLHSTKCGLLGGHMVCNCYTRPEWINLKDDWRTYNDWVADYGSIKNGVVSAPVINHTPIILTIPGWPITLVFMFVTGGAKRIPDYRRIETMEAKELSNNARWIRR